jgi:hypothetical protein
MSIVPLALVAAQQENVSAQQQQQQESELQDRYTEMINTRVERITELFVMLGFSEFEFNQSTNRITVSGYHGEVNEHFAHEDFIGEIMDFYGMPVIDYGANNNGIYFVGEWVQ